MIATQEQRSRDRRRGMAIGIIAVVVLALLGIALSGAKSSFSSSQSGTAKVQNGTLKLAVGDSHGSTGTFSLAFDGMAPGPNHRGQDTLNVFNSGTLDGQLVIDPLSGFSCVQGPVGPPVPLVQIANSYLLSIDGGSSKPISAYDAPTVLDNPLAANTGNNHSFTLELLSSPDDNRFQGMSCSLDVTARLLQIN